jgi:hypothetical protein
MKISQTWTLLLAMLTLTGWALWAASGHGSWPQWFLQGVPSAMAMGVLGFAIGRILERPLGRPAVGKPSEPQANETPETTGKTLPPAN